MNFWLSRTSLEEKYPLKDIKKRKLDNDISTKMTAETVKNIENRVMEWLKDPNTDSILTINLESIPKSFSWHHVQFSKSEVHFKSCANCWHRWLVAEAENWPRLISIPADNLIMNDYDDTVVAKNEIKSGNYGPKS